ncbi:MAG: PAS domain-containing protein, partial [Planctomycetes bacterium]|nr:PAS domain-containing protein [Planctomycetota bacterium]
MSSDTEYRLMSMPRALSTGAVLVLSPDATAPFVEALAGTWRVERAATPNEAPEALNDPHVRLAVVDARGGRRLGAWFSIRPPIPLLVIVDPGDDTMQSVLDDQGLIDVLAWPVPPRVLVAKVRMLMALATRMGGEAAAGGFLASLPTAAFTADAQGRIDEVNAEWCRMTGASSDDWSDAMWLDALMPDDRARAGSLWG